LWAPTQRGWVGKLARGIDHRLQLGDFSRHEGFVASGRDAVVAGHQRAQCFLALDELGVFQGHLQGVVDLFGDCCWRALGGVQAVPDGQVKTFEAHVLQRWVVFQQFVA